MRENTAWMRTIDLLRPGTDAGLAAARAMPIGLLIGRASESSSALTGRRASESAREIPVAEGAGISFIMLERSRSLRIPGTVFRRFASPEPTMGIAIAWRRGDKLPTLHRVRELAAHVARGWTNAAT